MDPISALGVAASIIAVVQLSSALLKPATSSLGPSDNDIDELNRLMTTMTGFRVAYNNLEEYLKSKPGTADSLVTAIQQPLRECKVVLVKLQLRLSNMTFVRKRILGAKWDKEYNRLIKRLDDARNLFDLILQGDQSQRLIEISEFMKESFVNLQEVKDGFETSATRLSELHLTVQDNHRAAEAQAAGHHSELLQFLENNHNLVDQRFSGLEKIEQRRQKDEILRWLEIADPRTNHQQACTSHKPGTGEWFMSSQIYRDWLAKPGSFLWLNGKAGCGKTVLSSTIIESISTHCDDHEGCVVAYFYFSFSDQNKQSYTNMLRSLLAQIASQIDLLPDCLISLHRAYQRSEPPVLALTNAFQKMVDEISLHHVYVHVDALDEIPDTDGREATCKILDELSRSPKVHIIMTSRREHDITEYASECGKIKAISIQNSAVDHDIRLWVREGLKEDRKFKKWSAIHDEIEAALGGGANGMFRWAACQLDSLKTCLSTKAVQRALRSLPKTLDETYERLLLAIDEEHQEVAIAALRWLCFSEEVLTISKLAEAAVFSAVVQAPSEDTPFEVSFDTTERIEDPLDILGILSGLVITARPLNPFEFPHETDDWIQESSFEHHNHDQDRDPASPPARTEKSVILLAHFSVKEYLVSRRLRDQVQPFAMDESLTHEQLATTCLYYVFFSQPFLGSFLAHGYNLEAAVDPLEYVNFPTIPRNFPLYSFFQYAKVLWLKHTQKVEPQSPLCDLIISLFSAELPVQECLFSRRLWIEEGGTQHTLTPLYVLSTFGLYQLVKRLLDSGVSMFSPEGLHGCALQAASSKGHESIVRLLLDYGANVNLKGGKFGCALQGACFAGYDGIVQLLLDRGADVNLKGGYYGSALQAASYDGKKSIVRLLLDQGADVNINGGEYGCALQAASCFGYEGIVGLLLDYGADLNLEGGQYGCALQGASILGHESILQLLLNHGADINCQGGHYGTALKAASYHGHSKVVQILLDHGADVEISGEGHFGTPIQAALRNDHFEISVMLLEHGAILAQEDYIGKPGAEIAFIRKDWNQLVDILLNDRDYEEEDYDLYSSQAVYFCAIEPEDLTSEGFDLMAPREIWRRKAISAIEERRSH